MNLLPEQYVERSKNKARGSRVAILVMLTLGAVVAFATHSRFSVNASSNRLLVGQARANAAIELEVDASSLETEKTTLESFIEQYQSEDTVFKFGNIVSTITNLLPESITLEELALDVVESTNGKGISGRLTGFATTDEIIASVVSELQDHQPFSSVRMDFSRSRTVRNAHARGFKISFFIDLEQPWQQLEQVTVAEATE